jgi:hypothetical protein
MEHFYDAGYEPGTGDEAPAFGLDQSGGLGVAYSLQGEISAIQQADAYLAAHDAGGTADSGLPESSASGSDDAAFLTAFDQTAAGDFTDPSLAQDAAGIEGMADPATDGTGAAIAAAQAGSDAVGGDYVNPDAEASLNAFNAADDIDNSVYQDTEANLALDDGSAAIGDADTAVAGADDTAD